MKKINFVTAILALFCSYASAAPIDIQTAAKVGQNYLLQKSIIQKKSVNNLKAVDLTSFNISANNPEYYIFNVNSGNGFVIVSGDDCIPPILAYSDHGSFDANNIPSNVAYWLNGYKTQISNLKNGNTEVSDPNNVIKWKSLLDDTHEISESKAEVVAPLITTTWNQGAPYNNLCPYDDTEGELTVTGCVATAMAQILKYWGHPTHGTGTHTYTHETYGTLTADFENTNYDWNNMPNSLTNLSNNTQKTAVATLMFHCGVSLEMNYGISANGGSGAYSISYNNYLQYCAENSFKNFFGYKTTLQGIERKNYDDDTWLSIVQSELTAGRPVYYSGRGDEGGHAFVCDGYDSDNKFHFNWGWGGYCDGYYTLSNLEPGVGGIGAAGGTFNANQQAIIGIEPYISTALIVMPGNLQMASAGDNQTFTVKSNLHNDNSWSAVSNQAWLTLSPSTGTGSGTTTTVTATAAPNETGVERTAIVTITQGSETETVIITQNDGSDVCTTTNLENSTSVDLAFNYAVSNYYAIPYTQMAEFMEITGIYNLDMISFANIATTATTGSFDVKVWDNNNGVPGIEIFSKTITITDLISDPNIKNTTINGVAGYSCSHDVIIETPITISGSFFVGIDISDLGASNEDGTNLLIVSSVKNIPVNTLFVYKNNSWTAATNIFTSKPNYSAAITARICPTEEPYLVVSTDSIEATPYHASYNVNIGANVNWTLSENADWISVYPTIGSGDTFLSVTVNENTTSNRSAVITINGENNTSATITVTQDVVPIILEEGNCDVLHDDVATTFNIFTPSEKEGYVSGSNEYGMTAIADYFGLNSGTYSIPYIDFRYATNATSGSVVFTIWDYNNGLPGAVIANKTVNISELVAIQNNANNGIYTWIPDEPIKVNGPFFCGVDAKNANYFGLASMTTPNSTAFQFFNGEWKPINQIWNTFNATLTVFPQICEGNFTPTISATPSPMSFEYAGNSQDLSITSNIAWSAVSSQTWLTLSANSGNGDNTISVTATANGNTQERTATITLSGNGITQTVIVTQAGTPALSVSPTTLNIAAAGSTDTITVSSNIAWTVSENCDWLSVSTTESENNGNFNVTVSKNLLTTTRSAQITVSGTGVTNRVITVNQAGATPSLSVTPTTLNVAAAGSTEAITVSSNISWTVSENCNWLSVSTTESENNGNFNVTVSKNLLTTTRSAQITVSGAGVADQVITVNQDAAAPSLAVTPTTLNIVAAGSTEAITVSSNIAWATSENCDWLSISTTEGENNGNFNVTVSENLLTTTRSAQITVSGTNVANQVITVNQDAAAPTLSVSPNILNIEVSGSTDTISVSSNISWTVTENYDWISVSKTNGENNGSFNVVVNENTTPNARNAQIIVSGEGIADKYITVMQSTYAPSLTVLPNTLNVIAEGTTETITVNSNRSWTVSEDCDWLSVSTTEGENNGSFDIIISENTNTESRTTNITVSGTDVENQIITVNQDGSELSNISTSINNINSLYPNPVSDILIIQTNYNIQSVQIIDLLGKVVINQNCSSGQTVNISVNELPSATYIVKIVSTDGTSYNRKISKE